MTVYVKYAVKSASAKKSSTTPTTGDVIFQIVQNVETGSKEKAHARIKELAAIEGRLSDFELGGWLSIVLEKSKADGNADWLEGCDSFAQYCEAQCDLKYLKAWHLIQVYNFLATHQVAWEEVKSIRWWKLSLLARAKIEKKYVAEWLAKAKTLTVKQLELELKGGKATTKPRPLTVRIHHEDQKETVRAGLDKAKEESATKYDAVALNNVMMAYLGNAVTMEFKCPHCGKSATSGADSG